MTVIIWEDTATTWRDRNGTQHQINFTWNISLILRIPRIDFVIQEGTSKHLTLILNLVKKVSSIIWKQNHFQSRFYLRLDQVKGCTLPKLPPGGKLLNCTYKDNLKVVCSMKCSEEQEERKIHCFLHYGQWHGLFSCNGNNGREIIQKPLQKLMQCRHKESLFKYIIFFLQRCSFVRNWLDVWFLHLWRGVVYLLWFTT